VCRQKKPNGNAKKVGRTICSRAQKGEKLVLGEGGEEKNPFRIEIAWKRGILGDGNTRGEEGSRPNVRINKKRGGASA